MMESISFLAAPFCLAILLVAIHAYLGMHVLRREVIFVDISLSQVAALGGAVSLFFVHDSDNPWLGLSLSLLFCLGASFALAFLRHYEKSVSQEAMIGMTYALASGALILVADRLPHGAEHLKEALIGNILFVTWEQVIQTLVIYGVIGLLHAIFFKNFWRASRGEENVFWWDFLFYFLFGVVITFSTKHAGVLVVFSILVAPAALARSIFTAEDFSWKQLVGAWIFGVVGLIGAFALSLKLDLPAGAAIVCTVISLFFLVLLAKKFVMERF